MEFIILGVLIIGALFFALNSRRSSHKGPRSSSPSDRHGRLPVIDRQSLQQVGASTQRPFDATSAEPQLEKPILCGMAYVVDGDTLTISKTQIRLFGVDAPEMNHPYGKKAKWALLSLCKGNTVRAEIKEKDDHGRTVAKCYLQDGRDLSAEMVKLGLAIDWPKYSGGAYKALEVPDARKKMWLADARQKGRMHVWEKYEASNKASRCN